MPTRRPRVPRARAGGFAPRARAATRPPARRAPPRGGRRAAGRSPGSRYPQCSSSDAGELRQRAPDPTDGLPDPLLVLNERESDMALPAFAEPDPGRDGDVRLAREPERELLRAQPRVRLRNRRPDEHRPPRRL